MMSVSIKMTGTVPKLVKREWNKVKRAGFEAMARSWHQKLRPKHFTKAGAREYRYSPRDGEPGTKGARHFSQSYTGRKLRIFGHTLPLVYTGQSRRLSQLRVITATSKGSKVRIKAPTLNRPRPRGKSMREEMTTVSRAEQRALSKLVGRFVNFKLRQWR